MRYFIILTMSFRSIGGTEIFMSNIIASAREHGYKPIVIHCDFGKGNPVYVPELRPFEKNGCRYLAFHPSLFFAFKRRRIIKWMKSLVPDCDSQSIVETHFLDMALWGELLAKSLGCRHLVYLLLQQNKIYDELQYNFFKFKYDRHELSAITDKNIPLMFSGWWKEPFPPIGYTMPAYCSNSSADIPIDDKYKLQSADWTIGSIGRSWKDFVPPVCDAISKFAKQNPNKHINVLFIGGIMTNEIKEKLGRIDNVRVFTTGVIFPVPYALIDKADVYVSQAGSCRLSQERGIPTISVDDNDFKAIGVVGFTTDNTIYREKEPQIEIDKLIEEILVKKVYKRIPPQPASKIDFTEYWRFVDNMAFSRSYFDVLDMTHPKLDKSWSKKSWLLYNMMNIKNYDRTIKLSSMFR